MRASPILLMFLSGCGLSLSPSYRDAGPAGLDAATDLDTGLDAARDAAADLDAEPELDAAADLDTGRDAAREQDARVNMHDVGRDAPLPMRAPVCGNGIVEAGEACDIGPEGLTAASAPCVACVEARGFDCTRPPARHVDFATEFGSGELSAWEWSLVGGTWSRASTTDEASCIVTAYLHGPGGIPGQDGWISPHASGCGVPAGLTFTAPVVRFRRTLGRATMPVTVAIGADNWLDGGGPFDVGHVFADVDGAPVMLTQVPRAREYGPKWIATIPPGAPGRVLTLRVHEAQPTTLTNNTGLYLNAWAPSVCMAE